MRIRLSLPDKDIEFVDDYARSMGVPSRSAVIPIAVRLLRAADLGRAYADAWEERQASDDAAVWDTTADDGIRR